ncbi:MAG: AAA family ATPase [Erysipelotrichaceae bacterium]|nr:AAA family ATPase [Erysipelotrichaceae bacterium]
MKKEIRYSNGTYYNGEVNTQGNPDGYGDISFSNGDTYTGEFVNNTLTGKGEYRYNNGNIYRGDMRNASRHGKGIMKWADGTWFEGEFVSDYIDGYGTMHFNDGVVFEGTMSQKDDKENGTYTYPDGRTVSGTFANGERNGYIVLTWPDGSSCEGYWYDGIFSGTGKIIYPDGFVYEGPFDPVNGYSREGNGVLKDPEGTRFEGPFRNHLKEGVFTITYLDGVVEIREFHNNEKVKVYSCKDAYGNDVKENDAYQQLKESIVQEEIKADPEKFLTVNNEENEGYADELKPYFKGLIGMDSVKQQLDRIYKRFKIDAMRRKLLSMDSGKQGYYFIVTGNPGTGKTTVARIIGMMLHDVGILPNETFVEVDRSGLVGEYIGQTEKKTAAVIESARGGTLFIDEAYTLYRKDSANDFGKEAIDTLLKDMEDHRGEYCVIMAGYSDQMNDMIRNANPGLSSRFDHKINIPDYSEDELVDILVSMALKKNFFIRKEARNVIASKIEKEKIDDTFDNARYARRLLDEAVERQALRLAENFDGVDVSELQILEAEDFGQLETVGSDLDKCLQQLNSLIGLSTVKKEISNITAGVRIQTESRKRGLAIAGDIQPVNMVFTGNPGTGKTTVARLVGKIYYHLGLLKRPDVFVECTRADLVGRYQGETALKVKEVVRNALGGVLFIDEAYSLVMNENDSFGLEAVNTLVSEMENNRDKLAVILAGYTEDMQKFLDSNPGLRSRLSRVIEFEDYTVEEMVRIFQMDMKKRGYNLAASKEKLTDLISRKSLARDFGNARGVRNLCDRVISRHNTLLFDRDVSELTNEVITTVTDSDLEI